MNDDLKENKTFIYERGKCKFTGMTKDDRKVLKLEIILYWTWRIVLGICGAGIIRYFY